MRKIIFDLDDTLYVSSDLRNSRENALKNFLGNNSERFMELKENNSTIESLIKMGISRETFFEIMNKVPIDLDIDEKLLEILSELKKDFVLIVVSNSSRICVEKTLKLLGILDVVDKFYGGEDFVAAKPHESCFSMVTRGDICVGNNFRKDLSVPKTLGAKTILIGKENIGADYLIEDIYAISPILIS